MKYNGIEPKEFTSDKPAIFDPPKKMYAWDDDDPSTDRNGGVYDIVAYIPERTYSPAVSRTCAYQHCAEIPEKPKPRRATCRELAKWLAKGNGQAKTCGVVYSGIIYDEDKACDDINGYLVRKWDDTEWHEPTVDYMFGEEE